MAKKRRYEVPKLDLHGVKHQDAEVIVENFVIFTNQLPLHIITGQSTEMIKIVTDILDYHGYVYEIGDYFNKGYINVIR